MKQFFRKQWGKIKCFLGDHDYMVIRHPEGKGWNCECARCPKVFAEKVNRRAARYLVQIFQ